MTPSKSTDVEDRINRIRGTFSAAKGPSDARTMTSSPDAQQDCAEAVKVSRPEASFDDFANFNDFHDFQAFQNFDDFKNFDNSI